jgi:hypothetical protein
MNAASFAHAQNEPQAVRLVLPYPISGGACGLR